MITTFLEYDNIISQLVKLNKGCFQFSFDYALNNHTFDDALRRLSYFDVVFNK
jgi:hypothetical protein